MRQYKAFISYRHMPLDIAVATRLHRMIERYRVPAEYARDFEGRRLGYVFRDQDELPVSSDLSANIQQALDHSEFLIVVCTPDTPASIWVEREICYFLKHHDRDHILAVLADGRPEQAFPAPLVHEYDEAGNVIGVTEPLAANIADPASDRKRTLKRLDKEALRIYAALIGCSFDALYQRERRYRNRRLAAVGGVALAVAVAYIALLTVKNMQISRQNEALIEQKLRIQYNESQLLAEDAARSLASGDYVAAMRASLEALPRDEEDSRPYCAQAESVLLSATGVFEPEMQLQSVMDARTAELNAPVHDMVFDADGARLYAIDGYGNLFAIDSLTGETLWRTMVMKYAQDRSDYLEIKLYEEKDCIIAASSYEVVCLNLEDGSERWRVRKYYNAINILALDAANDIVAFTEVTNVKRDKGILSLAYNYDLVVLQASTGGELHRVRILEDFDGLSLSSSSSYDPEQIRNGMFLYDGKSFVGYYFMYIDDEVCFFYVDFEAGTSRLLRTDSSSYNDAVFHMEAMPEEEALVVFQRSKENNVAFEMIKISLKDGEIIARGQTPTAEESAFRSGDLGFHMLRGNVFLYAGIGKYMYVINLETLECVTAHPLSDAITSLYGLGRNIFGYTLADGYYAVGWLTGDNNLCDTDYYFGLQIDLGANTRAALGGGGFMKLVTSSDRIEAAVCGAPEEGFGYVAIVPDDASHEVRILRLLPDLIIPEWEQLDFPEEGYYSTEFSNNPSVQLYGERALMIEYNRLDEGKYGYRVAAMDPQTRELTGYTDFINPPSRDGWLFSDGTGMFDMGTSSGVIARVDPAGGESIPLTEEKKVVLSVRGNTQYTGSETGASACYLSGDGRLLTAWCDGAQLRWWLDGEEQPTVPLPEDLVWQVSDAVKFNRMLRAAPCGIILFSDFGDDGTGEHMAGFAAYDIANDRWLRAEDAAGGNAKRLFAGGEVLPRVATLDSDGCLRAYDLESGEPVLTLPLDLPLNYVKQLQFILDDRYILLRMEDGQLSVYGVESGERAYRGTLKLSSIDRTSASLDSEGKRVVLIDTGSGEGIVLDFASWTELARLKDACCFDPQRDMLYTTGYVSSASGFRFLCRRIPDIRELADIVRNAVG